MSNFAESIMTIALGFPGLQEMTQDSLQATGMESAYDSVWAAPVPTAPPSPLESIMLAQDKIYVVLAVVLIIWFGIVLMLMRTDRKIRILERRVADGGSPASGPDKDGD